MCGGNECYGGGGLGERREERFGKGTILMLVIGEGPAEKLTVERKAEGGQK